MAYSPTTWVDGTTPALDAANLNHLETGAANALDKTDMTAKGDTLVATASGAYTRLGVGANDTVPVAASGQTTGIIWQQIGNAQIASGAAIGISKLAGYPSDGTKVLKGDGTWGTTGLNITYQTTLPGSPTDGQYTILVDSTSAPTYNLLLRYNSTDAKWGYIGGTGIYAEVTTTEAHGGGGTYTALTTAGPSIALPYGGDWFVEVGFDRTAAVNATADTLMSYDIGGTGAVDADAARAGQSATGAPDSVMRRRKKTGLTAVTLTAKYKTNAGLSFENRWMYVEPIRIA